MKFKFRIVLFIIFLMMSSVVYAQSATEAYEEGVRLYWGYKIEESVVQFDSAISQDENFADAYAYRGLAHTRLSNFDQAQADFDRAVELAPDSALVYALRARFTANQNLAQALNDIEMALELEPDFAIALYMRGVVYSFQEKYVDALAEFDATLVATVGIPDFAYTEFLMTVYVGRGIAQADRGFYEEAIAEYDLASAFGLNEPILYYYRGIAYLDANETTEALADFNLAIEIDPNYAPALEELTRFYGDRNSHAKSLEYNLLWIEAEPQNADAFVWLGYNYENLDRISEAYTAADTATQLDPNNSYAWNNRGYYNYLLGNTQQALLDYLTARKADITNLSPATNGGSILAESYAIQLSDIASNNTPWVANEDNGSLSMNDEGLYVNGGECGSFTQPVMFVSGNEYTASFGVDSTLRIAQNVLFFEDSQTATRELARLRDNQACLTSRSGGLVGGKAQGIDASVTIPYADEGFYAYIEGYSLGGIQLSYVGQVIYFRVYNIIIVLGMVGTGDLVFDPSISDSETILAFGNLALSKLTTAPLVLP